MKHLKLILPIVFCLIVAKSYAQQEAKLFTADWRNVGFDQVVSVIEKGTNYHFYYNHTFTDTLKINLSFEAKSIDWILLESFKNTNLKFSIDYQNNIYVTLDREILTELPTDYFDIAADGASKNNFDFSDYQQEQKKIKTDEERIYVIGSKAAGLQGTATLAGFIKNIENGEPIVGASVFIEKPLIGVATDQFGYFSINLPKGKHQLKIHSLNMKPTFRQVIIYADGRLNVDMEEEVISLKEVIVQSERDAQVLNLQMGTERLDIKTLKQTPVVLGEADVIKLMLTMPGVQSVGEGSSGINVRGGATSQNLILLNDALIFNPSHLFGFFSTFNPDVLKSAELLKSSITADYGGRLASVLDVSLREGNKKKFSGAGGISPVTGRIALEGPIIKDKVSFLVGGRSTYSDWLLKQVDDPSIQNSSGKFYDLNAFISADITEKDNLYLTAYSSRDQFKLNNDTLYSYQDQNLSIKYKHIFSNKLYGVIGSSLSQYDFELNSTKNPTNAFMFNYNIRVWNSKVHLNYFLNPHHTLSFGINSVSYQLNPGKLTPVGSESIFKEETIQNEKGRENAIYVDDNIEISNKLSVYAGLRYSFFNMFGPRTVYKYVTDLPRETSNIIDTLLIQKNKSIASYGGFEPRLSLRYLLQRNLSLKLSYNRTRQYIHMLSNTVAISPTDVWKLSDNYLRPQVGNQLSMGLYMNSRKKLLEYSVEGYLKSMVNFLDFKNGAVLFMNQSIETDVISTRGKAYGLELSLKKPSGKLNGWISYTYSRSLLKTSSNFNSETINGGTYYPANFDKPHALNVISNYKFSQRLSISANITYSTGRPITIPLAKYELNGTARLAYSDRNEFRVPDYFRMDLGLNFEGNHKVRKLAHGSWSLSVYNLTGRNNAYSVYFISKNGVINGYQLSIFARPIPTITYNFRF